MTRARDLADSADKDIAGTLTLDAVNASGVITGLTVEATGDTAAGDNAALGYTAAEGLVLTGQGSTNDVTIKNDADADVIEIPTGTVNVTMAGTLGVVGEIAAASLDISGNIDVDGTTNLDVVDIDGAVDMATTLLVTGLLTNTGNISITETGANNEKSLTIANSSANSMIGVEGSSGNRFVGSAANNMFIGCTSADGLEFATNNTVRANIASDGSASFNGIVSFPDGSAGAPSITNTGDNDTGLFFPAANEIGFSRAGTEYGRITSNGQFSVGAAAGTGVASSGIGKISINAANAIGLSIANFANNAGGSVLTMGHSRSGTVGTAGTTVNDDDTLGTIRFAGDDGTDMQTQAALINCAVDGTPGSNDMPANLTFHTNAGAASASERMRITASGKIGINTNDPTGFVHVNGNTAVNNIGYHLVLGGVGGGQSGEVYGHKIGAQSNNSSSDTYGIFSQAAQGVGGNSCGVYGDNHVNSLTQNSGARSIGVWGKCVDNSGANGGSPYLANAQIKAGVLGMVTHTNSSSNATNAAVVANNLCSTAALTYGIAMHTTAGPNAVRGLEYDHNGTVVLVIAATGNVTNTNNSYGAISDLKLKENISAASSQWDDIKAVQVKNYSLKTDELDAANRIGVIAQDLEASGMGGLVENDVMPITDEDGIVDSTQTETTKQVKYSVLYMKAVKALQEAMIRIEALETKVTALEG